MTAHFLVGDVRDRMAQLEDGTFDFILCSPPFLALRSYLPEDHPDKAKEIGSEATPAAFLDVLLELTAEWGRLLAPHGSIAIELGDTYAGSGGAGGDYNPDGLREGQQRFVGSATRGQSTGGRSDINADTAAGLVPLKRSAALSRANSDAWPLDKSLACIPQLYMVALAYGINPLTGAESSAGRWRVRNLKPWIRSNPPVGALGDKERPATSYVVVACRARDRWFDLDAVRTTVLPHSAKYDGGTRPDPYADAGDEILAVRPGGMSNAAGAPPRDWWHHVDAILDTELAARAGQRNGGGPVTSGGRLHARGNDLDDNRTERGADSVGAQGVHLRRALERAGILTTLDALDVSPRGYSGAHYAVWPPELVRLLIDEMCPRRVCIVCGEPSRRIVDTQRIINGVAVSGGFTTESQGPERLRQRQGDRHRNTATTHPESNGQNSHTERQTIGWSDCDCGNCTCRDHDHRGNGTRCKFCPCDLADHWRPGRILDPFVGSGTTLAVASGMGRDATGIDIDERNAWLAYERVGMFLTIDQREVPA